MVAFLFFPPQFMTKSLKDPTTHLRMPNFSLHCLLFNQTYISEQSYFLLIIIYYYYYFLCGCTVNFMGLPLFFLFLCPRDESRGHYDLPLSVRLSVRPSVCPSVRHTLRYRVCVINSSHSFQWIILKPCISVVDILKMCMWVFGGARINFDRITAFRT